MHSLFNISDSNSSLFFFFFFFFFFFLDGSYSNTVYINSTEMMILFKFKFAVRN